MVNYVPKQFSRSVVNGQGQKVRDIEFFILYEITIGYDQMFTKNFQKTQCGQ